MVIKVQPEVYTILIIAVLLCVLMICMGSQIKKLDPAEKPAGLANLGIILVTCMDDFTSQNMGAQFRKHFAPYIGSLMLYMSVANLSGLFGLPAPTANYSVTLTLAFISWCIIMGVNIHSNTLKGYLKGLLEPFFVMLPVNVFGEIAPLLSMSLRLFGNILVGGILMTLVYTFTGWLTSILLPFLGEFNIIGIAIAPILHAYFDVFAGLIQMFIFISLTTILAGNKAA